jgi:methionine-rich copper-binding protein CopC
MRRLIAFTIAAALAIAAPAFAHTKVKSTSPKRGGTARTSVGAVTVTFTQAIQRGSLLVTGPGGTKVSKGNGGRDPRKISRVRVSLKGSLAAGRYTARWKITAADGHAQSGSFRFRLR